MPNSTKQAKPRNTTAAPASPMEPSAAEAAFQSLRERLDQIPRDELAPVNVDAQAAAVFALGVSRFVQEPSVRARFARLAKSGEYEGRCVDDLGPAAQAAWYARHRYLMDQATRSQAQVPMTTVDVALTLRSRLLRLAEYWLSEEPEVAAELAAIRVGTGYQDLANDLVALAALSERHRPLLSQDRKLYQAGDAALAKQLSGRILEQLGASVTAEQNERVTAQARAWTHLMSTYEEVRRGGRFLFPGDEGDTRFPSLVTVARAAANRAPKGETPAPDAAGEPQAGASAKEPAPPG